MFGLSRMTSWSDLTSKVVENAKYVGSAATNVAQSAGSVAYAVGADLGTKTKGVTKEVTKATKRVAQAAYSVGEELANKTDILEGAKKEVLKGAQAQDQEAKAWKRERELKKKKEEAAALVWGIWDPEKQDVQQKLKKRCLELSADENTFLEPLPDSQALPMSTLEPFAVRALKHDTNLGKQRYKLVPRRITEKAFWQNYFCAINTARVFFGVESLFDPAEIPEIKDDNIEEELMAMLEDEPPTANDDSPEVDTGKDKGPTDQLKKDFSHGHGAKDADGDGEVGSGRNGKSENTSTESEETVATAETTKSAENASSGSEQSVTEAEKLEEGKEKPKEEEAKKGAEESEDGVKKSEEGGQKAKDKKVEQNREDKEGDVSPTDSEITDSYIEVQEHAIRTDDILEDLDDLESLLADVDVED